MHLSKQIKQKNILPKYNIVEKKNCILHFGIGNFHRAHQALYVHELLEQNKDLSIIGVNLRSNKTKNLKANLTKSKKILKYKVKTNIHELIKIMMKNELEKYNE